MWLEPAWFAFELVRFDSQLAFPLVCTGHIAVGFALGASLSAPRLVVFALGSGFLLFGLILLMFCSVSVSFLISNVKITQSRPYFFKEVGAPPVGHVRPKG